MIPIAIVKLIVSILVGLRLIPKCQLITKLGMTVLEDELKQLNNASTKQQTAITNLRRDYKDLEKLYQATFLVEQEGQKLIKKQATQISKLHKEKEEAETAEDVATQQYLSLQSDMDAATELSFKLKEALTKWTS